VVLIGQSGLLAAGMTSDIVENESLNISKVCSIGNKCDVNENDLLEYFGNEEGIDVISMYLETITNGRTLTRIAKKVAAETAVKAVKKADKHAQGTVCYTLSPVHTLEHYLGIVRRLIELNCDSICIKDMAGLLSPYDAYELITALKAALKIPVELHTHYTSGMASSITVSYFGNDGTPIAIGLPAP
jgi:pyruvate/oxaloacetate carboxyltransferase